MTATISVDQVEYVKELYPRLKPEDAAIERYRDAVTLLSLQTGQSYEAIDADAREEART